MKAFTLLAKQLLNKSLNQVMYGQYERIGNKLTLKVKIKYFNVDVTDYLNL